MISLDEGYELILGSSIDPQFGPILLFGTGGQLVEVFKDRSLALPPLTAPLARRMMERTKIYQALKGVRGRKPIDLENLENILVQFSNLAAEQKWIKECDINPLLVSGERVIALDARIILHDPATQIEKIPKIAIRPYPAKYIEEMQLREGTKVTVRPVKAEDVPLMAQFLEKLSETTMRQRFLKFIQYDEIEASDRLKRLCFIDYDREMAIIVKKGQEILAVGRLTKLPDTEDARFAITIRDDWQKKGIGSKLMQSLVNIAKQEKIQRILAYMLEENAGMKKICEKFGFSLTLDKEQDLLFAELVL